jgi:ABC-type nitrate/sulfonate/bicarbonate transport system ATPase subunit
MKRKVDLSANEIYETLRKYRFEHFDSTNKLLINNDYGLEVIDENNEFIETSEGGSQVCAITLITALKENINHDAPLLMDSPFMRIDDEYRQALVDLYVVKSKQTILLVSPTELIEGSDLDRKIKDLADKRYSITRTSDVESEVLPL